MDTSGFDVIVSSPGCLLRDLGILQVAAFPLMKECPDFLRIDEVDEYIREHGSAYLFRPKQDEDNNPDFGRFCLLDRETGKSYDSIRVDFRDRRFFVALQDKDGWWSYWRPQELREKNLLSIPP